MKKRKVLRPKQTLRRVFGESLADRKTSLFTLECKILPSGLFD